MQKVAEKLSTSFCHIHTRPKVNGRCPDCDMEAITPEKRQEIEQKQKITSYRHASGIPYRFKDCSIGNYVCDSDNRQMMLAVATIKSYIVKLSERIKAGGGLTFYGKCGTGKTHLATAIVNAAVNQCYQARYCKVYELIGSIKESWSNNNLNEQEIISTYVKPELLVIDEVGVQFGTEAERQLLFRVLNARYERIKPTIIVSNLDRDELADCIGERAIDRLKEGQGAEVAFTWGSHRK